MFSSTKTQRNTKGTKNKKEMKMRTMRWMVGKAGMVAVVALMGAVWIGAGEVARQVTAGDLLSKAVVVVGTLEKPLGTYVTVEGVRENGIKSGVGTLHVDTVNGKKLETPVSVVLENLDLQDGTRYVLRGYETVEMVGQPADPEHPGRPMPQAGFQLRPLFRAVEIKSQNGVLMASGGVSKGSANVVREVSAQDLKSEATIVAGELGKRLGTYMTVEGDYFGPPAMTKSGLFVDTIDTNNRGTAVQINVEDRDLAKPMEAGRRYRLRGYETGNFRGMVDDPQNPPSKEEVQRRQMARPYTLRFETVFHVTKAEDLGPAKGAKP
jgi:hypothetical protein